MSMYIEDETMLGYVRDQIKNRSKQCENKVDNTKLKPCPFCGCHDRKVGIRRMGNKGYAVICGNCGSKGSYIAIKEWHDNKMIAQGQAIKAWNSRVN